MNNSMTVKILDECGNLLKSKDLVTDSRIDSYFVEHLFETMLPNHKCRTDYIVKVETYYGNIWCYTVHVSSDYSIYVRTRYV